MISTKIAANISNINDIINKHVTIEYQDLIINSICDIHMYFYELTIQILGVKCQHHFLLYRF